MFPLSVLLTFFGWRHRDKSAQCGQTGLIHPASRAADLLPRPPPHFKTSSLWVSSVAMELAAFGTHGVPGNPERPHQHHGLGHEQHQEENPCGRRAHSGSRLIRRTHPPLQCPNTTTYFVTPIYENLDKFWLDTHLSQNGKILRPCVNV